MERTVTLKGKEIRVLQRALLVTWGFMCWRIRRRWEAASYNGPLSYESPEQIMDDAGVVETALRLLRDNRIQMPTIDLACLERLRPMAFVRKGAEDKRYGGHKKRVRRAEE